MTNFYDGTEYLDTVTNIKVGQGVVYKGTALPVGAANYVPQYGFFCLVNSLSAPTTAVWYIQTSATISSPSFTQLPSAQDGELPYLTLSTTIGDYTSPASAVVSSTESDSTTASNTTQDGSLSWGGTYTRYGIKLGASSALIGVNLSNIKFYVKKFGSPSGNMTCRVRDSGDSIKATADATIDSSTLTTSFDYITYTFATPPTLASGDKILLEFGGGGVSDYIITGHKTTDGYDSTNTYYTHYDGSYTDQTSYDITFKLNATSFAAANTVDGSTTTEWKSTSEANPRIYVDLTSAREIVGIALNINKTATTVTSLKIRASTDTSFADAENIIYVSISDFTDDTWRFMANNFLATNCRYVQFYANETGVLAINEIKVRYGVSDTVKILGHRHNTRTVASADSFVDSN